MTIYARRTTLPVPGDADAAGDAVVLEVEDTGVGIPATALDHIFDPFFTTKAPGEGTGLGLSTSLAIVKQHGGEIRVESQPGHGTRFLVYLPAGATAVPPVASDIESPPPRGRGETVLFVDDEPAIRRVAEHALEASGYRVLLAANGAEGLQIYRERGRAIDIVVTDMMMPVLGGDALIRELRQLTPDVRVVAASGISGSEAVARDAGLASGSFLAKPFTTAALLRVLRATLDGPSP